MDLISVIVPVYKVEKYLDECIESVVSQTYENLEIILVDDGSPDRCPEICDAWAEKDSRIRVIHKENGGLADAWNVGKATSSGAYIAFVDSDDLIEPEYIEYLYSAICETGADLSQCRYQYFRNESEIIDDTRRICPPVIITGKEALYRFSNCFLPINHHVWDKLYQRELIENELFLYGRQAQDVLFSCHVFGKCSKIAYIDNILYQHRVHAESATGKFIKQRLDSLETHWQSLNYLGEFYPQFVKDAKNYYLTLCFGAYEWIMENVPKDRQVELMRKVNSYRRKIKYSKEEWASCSLKYKIRYICSMPAFIKLSVKIRPLLGRPNMDRQTIKDFRED